ncbi:DUF4340 domain-containing protein [Akkermansiaceae bacterium]|nr:DUF4340 domain-containing protein [Akkermansiaceae bacterium]
MRYFSSIFLTLIALALGGLVILQTHDGNLYRLFGAPPLGQDDTLYDFDPKEVGRIEILGADGTQGVLEKIGGAWVVKKPWEDIADPSVALGIINFAGNLVIEDVIDRDEVDDLAEFGLSSSKIELQLYDKGGTPLCHFNLGNNTAWRSLVPDEDDGPSLYGTTEKERTSSFPTVVIWPAEREQRDYLYVCGDIANPAIRVEGIKKYFENGLRRLRNHNVFYRPPAYAAEISLNDGSAEIVVARDRLSKNSPWHVTKPYELAANPDAVKELVAILTNLRATAVLDESSEALADPLPENLAQTIKVKFFLPDGSVSSATSVYIYPPETDSSAMLSAIIGTGPNQKRSAILKLPRDELVKLPKNVNELRSRTLTSLEITQIQSLSISDAQGRDLKLSLEYDPHERAKRWHVKIGSYEGPANEEQVGILFKALFVDEILNFSDDAATDLPSYGLDQPGRNIEVTLKDGTAMNFAIGESQRQHFYARNTQTQRILEISKSTFDTLAKGSKPPELATLFRETPTPQNEAQSSLAIFGIEKPKTITLAGTSGPVLIEFGSGDLNHFYSNRIGTARVAEVTSQIFTKIAMEDFRWRSKRIWSIDPFEIRGLVIERKGRPVLQLSYNFFSRQWKAREGGKDITARLNVNKANRLLEKLSDIKAHRWLGPDAQNATFLLNDPNLSISVSLEEVDDTGKVVALVPHQLKVAQIVSGAKNRFYYASLSSDPDFFLIDVGSVKSLAVELIE